MKSALFIDFDNVFTQLRQVNADAADRFARHPTEWIQWLAESLPLPDPRSLRIARLVWLSGSGGKLLDPATHYVRGEMTLDADSSWAGHEEMFDVIAEVCGSTGTPMFSPRELAVVLTCLAEDVAEHPFELASTAGRVLDRCKAKDGLRVRRRDLTFLLRGLLLTGHVFGEGNDSLAILKERLAKQVLFLCAREQMPLNEQVTAHIRSWIDAAAVPAA